MKKFKHILRPVGIALAMVGVLVALGFVERTADRAPITDIRIEVTGGEGLHFIDAPAVRREVLDQGGTVMGAYTGSVDVTHIEDRLRSIPCVAAAEVYHTMDGILHVRVDQRVPIVRILPETGASYYMDEEGWVMPTDPDYTARVLIVTGHVREPGAEAGVYSVYASDSLQQLSMADEIHRLASFIAKDPFWNVMIDQVVVTPENEFELIPRIGSQRIQLGDGSELEQRFRKLRIFYEKGIPRSDWRRYARIDLRYADQIVCTKRTTP